MRSKRVKKNSGITLIALVITIIVMLILVAVTISMAVNGGLFEYAGKAGKEANNAIRDEQQLASGKIQIGGVWYDSIDDYIKGEPSGPIKIKLGRTGTKVTNVPVPAGFRHKEGTIDTGYVIVNETDGNEFVWVPVEKNQKLTIEVESKKDIKKLEIYDPYGDKILEIADGEIEGTYSNEEIELTVNGMYMAVAITENEETGDEEITQKTITIKSLYAIDSMNDVITSEEYVKSMVAGTELENASREELYAAMLGLESVEALEAAIESAGCVTLDQFLTIIAGQETSMCQDLVNYNASVEANGGFYIARYEAGIPETKTARTNGSADDSVETIIGANGIPVSKADVYPYNYITHAQAKDLAEKMYEENDNYEVSLITGSGWDRTLGWIYETGRKSVNEIYLNSGSWGNYSDVSFDITKREYSEDYGQTYTEVSGKYTKLADQGILLTTGARNESETTPRNFANNISDLAGNVEEWTNEVYSSGDFVSRGGYFDDGGDGSPAASRFDNDTDAFIYFIGFRPALYIK